MLLDEPFVRRATALFEQLTVALVGIGGREPSGLLASSGNVFSTDELATVRDAGGVGDIGLRYLAADGRPVDTPLDTRVIGIELDATAPGASRHRRRGWSFQGAGHPGGAPWRLGQLPHHRPVHRTAAARPDGRGCVARCRHSVSDIRPIETTNLDRYGHQPLLTARYSAPSAGPPPWQVFRLRFDTVFGVATAEPNGATRWRFSV